MSTKEFTFSLQDEQIQDEYAAWISDLGDQTSKVRNPNLREFLLDATLHFSQRFKQYYGVSHTEVQNLSYPVKKMLIQKERYWRDLGSPPPSSNSQPSSPYSPHYEPLSPSYSPAS